MSKHSSKLTVQMLSKSLKKAGINDIIISPGSRNAPLIIELTQQDFFKNYSIIDERSAGFFALGKAGLITSMPLFSNSFLIQGKNASSGFESHA